MLIFCQILGNVTGSASLFSIVDLDYNASFVPLFYDNLDTLFGNDTELRQKAIALCGSNNFQCMFDYVLTSDSQQVQESQTSLSTFETEQKQLRKYNVFYY